MRQYQKYKPFQYDWLPVIPEHWDSKPLRKYFYISDERKGEQDTLELLSVYREYGVIPKASRNDNKNVESENTSKYKVVHTDDLVINKMKLWQGSLGISNFNGFVSPAYIVAHNEFDGNLRYLNFFLRSPLVKTYYNRISYGIRVGQWDSDFYDFKQLIVPIPPKDEQNQIVRYLDWKVSHINRLIHGYQRQIKLLEEAKNTIVDNAVFHGLGNNNLVFSGNNLLEDIPEHWKIVKLRTLLTPISIKNHPSEQLLSVVREQGIIVRDVENKESNHNYIPDDLSGYKLVEQGNFVINKMKAWQGSYGVSNYRGIVSPAYYVFDLKYECPDFFHIAIRSKRYVQFFNQASDGIRVGQWDLSMSRMKEIPFVVPPVEEQMEIVDYIKAKFAEIESVKPMLEKEIELLREYRTRLISDVVTGQVDVRGVEIPDYTPEEDNAVYDENNDTEEVTENAD